MCIRDSDDTKKKVVQEVNLVNPGIGYTCNPEVAFFANGDSGVGAAATAKMENGTIGIVTVTAGGSGYTTTPTITVTAQNGISTTGAACTAVIDNSGSITAIHIQNAGCGYTVAPTISIAAPPTGSSGNFSFNETVTGGTSGATGRVRTWNASSNELELGSISGDFMTGETLTGGSSGATHVVRIVDTTNFDEGYGENDEFEIQADAILDFTEGNPFGTP